MSEYAAARLDWLSERLGRAVSRCSLDDDVDKLNKLSRVRFALVKYCGKEEGEEEEQGRLVFKEALADAENKRLGLAREALFYSHWRDLEKADGCSRCEIDSVLPRVYHAEGSMDTGAKLIVMADLSDECVQSGYFFGLGNPNNWGKDLAALRGDDKPPLSVAQVTALAFSAAAKLHAPFWGSRALGSVSWLRASGWVRGADEAAWSEAQASARANWQHVKAQIERGEAKAKWDPRLVACVDASVGRASPERGGWAAYQAELAARPFTLVHGDFHPANMLVRRRAGPSDADAAADGAAAQLLLVDWEAVGVGSGPQDLGQYLLSHATPDERAALERPAVAAYYAELTALNPAVAASMSLEQCWAEVVQGGLGRWIYFLTFDGFGGPAAVSQFFHDQVLAFVEAHGVTPDAAPMPRV